MYRNFPSKRLPSKRQGGRLSYEVDYLHNGKGADRRKAVNYLWDESGRELSHHVPAAGPSLSRIDFNLTVVGKTGCEIRSRPRASSKRGNLLREIAIDWPLEESECQRGRQRPDEHKTRQPRGES